MHLFKKLEEELSIPNSYIAYNSANGINLETQLDLNKVINVEKMAESEVSWKKAAFDVGESYKIENYDQSGRTVATFFMYIEGDSNSSVDISIESQLI